MSTMFGWADTTLVDKRMDRPTAREIETERIMKGGSDWRLGGLWAVREHVMEFRVLGELEPRGSLELKGCRAEGRE